LESNWILWGREKDSLAWVDIVWIDEVQGQCGGMYRQARGGVVDVASEEEHSPAMDGQRAWRWVLTCPPVSFLFVVVVGRCCGSHSPRRSR